MDQSRPAAVRVTRLEPSAEAILDASPNGALATDDNGRIVYANPRVEELFGWAPSELRGRPVETLIPDRLGERHASLRTAYNAEPSARPMGQGGVLTAARRDGSEFAAEIGLAPLRSRRRRLVVVTIVDKTAQVELEQNLRQAQAALRHRMEEQMRRAREMTHLAELGELLESCETLDEAHSVIARVAEPLFTGDSGALYALAPEGTAVEAVAAWGTPPPTQTVFAPADCWALRRGHLHVVREGEDELRCLHVGESITGGAFCMPLVAQTETVGLLHLQLHRRPHGRSEGTVLTDRQVLLDTFGRHVSLALANIRLREKLRDQSARDPLTGLFNRRYLEETLDRELRRANREEYALGLILADLDHFKALNDAFGHMAGDETLRGVARYLESAVRGDDIACRYGGEEFVIVLPRASVEDAHRRADALREGIKNGTPNLSRPLYPTTTMSIGVAAYPEHGASASELILAADSAMYRAKALGRDRVIVAGGAQGVAIEHGG